VSLPIVDRKEDIIRAIRRHPVVVVTGETGSGKTTQIPKMCIEAGRGLRGMIGCTQPRRIAAVTVAQRIAEELGEDVGRVVGYKIRFEDRSGPRPLIKLMTDGILLMEAQTDPRLRAYDTIIVDEAHERSLNIDFVLGILRKLLLSRRDLKVIVTSATIDTEKFSRAFDHAPIIEVSGRMYPVELHYRPIDPEAEEKGDFTYVDAAVQAVEDLRRQRKRGDILIFMPTEQDIRETCDLLEDSHVRPSFGGGTTPRLPAHDRPENRRGHQCGRDIHYDSRHPLCDRHRHGEDFPLQPPHADDESPDTIHLTQQRGTAKGPLRTRPERSVHPALRRRGF
jgi:ATP-dependent helicase HrpA